MGRIYSTYDDEESCTAGKPRRKSRSRGEDNVLYALPLEKKRSLVVNFYHYKRMLELEFYTKTLK